MVKGVAADDGGQFLPLPTPHLHSKRSAVHKVAEVLHAIRRGEARNLTAISDTTGLALSTVHRIANELVESGLLRRSCDGYYSMSQPGPEPERAGATSVLPRAAVTVLDDLAAVTRKVSRLGTRQGAHMVSVARIPNQSPLPPETRIDQRPLHACAMGKVLLAFAIRPDFDAAMRHGLQAHTSNTITDHDKLAEQLAQIRRTGVAYDFGELDTETSTIAVPVLGGGRFAVAALELQSTGEPDLRRLERAAQMAARTLRRVLLASMHHDGLE